MRAAYPHALPRHPVVFGATKKIGIALALCGAFIAFCGSARKASAQAQTQTQTPTPGTLDRSVKPELVAPPSLPLELRGILIDERGSFFGFYNLKNGRSTWIALGKPMDGFIVRSHDEGSDWITAEFEGHVFTMALKNTPLGETGLSAPPVAAAAPVPRVKGSEAVQSEILNRKVLRLRAQKSRLKKVLEKNAYVIPEETKKE